MAGYHGLQRFGVQQDVAGAGLRVAKGKKIRYTVLQMQRVDSPTYLNSRELPLGFSSLIEIAGFFRFPAKEGSSEKAKLLWLIRLRWMAILLFSALFPFALKFVHLERSQASIYLGILGVLGVFNLISHLFVAEAKEKFGPVFICYQLGFDLLVLTALLWITGGFTNPFVSLFFLNVSLGGILIAGRLSLPFLILTHTLLAVVQFKTGMESGFDSSLLPTFGVYHLLTLGVWLVMRSLGAHLELQHSRQTQAQVTLERHDRLRSIGALTAGFSHEFASPLNVAKIRIERVKRDLQSEDIDEAMAAIEACEKVIHQMNSSQLDSRSFRFNTVNVRDLLSDIIESWREDKDPVNLDIRASSDMLCHLPPVNFAQVVINILDNAFEANPKGPILISLSQNDSDVVLSISDEGSGFRPDILERKGEPFVTTKAAGTGLGLYVTELFVQSLGGSMELLNRPDEGATVILRWPQRES